MRIAVALTLAVGLLATAAPAHAQSPVTVSDDVSPCTELVVHQEVPGPLFVDSSPVGAEGPFSLCVSDGSGRAVRVEVESVEGSPVKVSDDLSPCTQLLVHQEVPGPLFVDSSPVGAAGPFSVCVSNGSYLGLRFELPNPDLGVARVSDDLGPCTELLVHQEVPGPLFVDSSPLVAGSPYSLCVSNGSYLGLRLEVDTL